mgnify:CR=1 FL=1
MNKIAERIHIAPVGFEVDRIVLPAKQWKADKVYLLVHDNKSEDKATAWIKDVKKELKSAKIESEEVYADWRDIESITKVTRDLLLRLDGNNIYINLASGSKNHAIALDRAVMTLDESQRQKIEMFYAESENYIGFSHPKQLSTGLREIKSVRSHRIVIPDEKLIGGECSTPGIISLISLSNDNAIKNKINLDENSNVLLFGCEGDADEELYQKLLNSN